MILKKPIYLYLLLLAVAGALSGCLSGGSDESSIVGGPTTPPAAGNTPPSISGTPITEVAIGFSYRFAPNASDSDGDSLTFSIQNKPGWADFNASTGLLTGTPTAGDVGTYDNIVVSVSDGTDSTPLAGFSINVVTQGSGSVTLDWTAPTQNVDGTPLTDLAGYVIYYGTRSGDYEKRVSIDNPSVTTYIVEGLTPNNYYFVATAVNSLGEESRYSGEYFERVLSN